MMVVLFFRKFNFFMHELMNLCCSADEDLPDGEKLVNDAISGEFNASLFYGESLCIIHVETETEGGPECDVASP
jgi:hypothetical protein